MITLKAPASKSVSHRTLIAAALADGVSMVHGLSECEDLARTEAILCNAGATIENLGTGIRRVTGMPNGPVGGQSTAEPISCNVGESGTTCRLMTAVLAAGHGSFRIHGVPRLHERPLGALLRALTTLGASITCEQTPGKAPLRLDAYSLSGGDITLALDESSQYLSGLLLAAPFCHTSLRITVGGEKIVSWPYVGLTLETLAESGIFFDVEKYINGVWQTVDRHDAGDVHPNHLRITVHPSRYHAGNRIVEGDWSGASYLLAAGAVGTEPVLVTGLRENSLQGDRAILQIMRAMGAEISLTASGILVSPSSLHGIDVDMGDCPDLVPTIAALAVFASGTTRIRGVAHLRLKESDRIAAPAMELRRVGVSVNELDDGLAIHGHGQAPDVSGICFKTHGDHRIAMSLALFGLHNRSQSATCGAVCMDHPEVVRKSFPEFWEVLRQEACPSAE